MSYNNVVISSDDPKAIEKLTEKLEKCQEKQDFMKKVNAYYKKNGTCLGCEGLTEQQAQKLDIDVQTGYSWEKQRNPQIEKAY